MEQLNWKLLFGVFFFVIGTHGFFLDGPCYIDLMHNCVVISALDLVFMNEVSAKCHSGTADWSYPQGHVMLHFQNPTGESTSVCIRDRLGGNAFAYTDVTSGRHRPLGDIVTDHYTCTTKSNSTDIVLKIDAPHLKLYMGAFDYLMERHA